MQPDWVSVFYGFFTPDFAHLFALVAERESFNRPRRIEVQVVVEKLSLNNIIVLVPLGHVLVAAIYLWSWFSGFGANLSILADPKDVFGLSIRELVPIYVTALLLPVLSMGWRYSQAAPTADHMAAQIQDASDREVVVARHARFRRQLLWGFVVVAAIGGIASLLMYLRGWPINSVFAFVTMGGAVVLLFACREWAPFTGHVWEAVIIGLTLTASAIASGVVAGQTARHVSYDLASGDAPHCGASVVLRKFGERYVAVLPNGQKVVTDLSCKLILVIPPHRPLANVRFYWQPFPYVRLIPVKGAVV